MLISFEGIDGCGKSTQIELVKNYLYNKGYEITVIREPGGTDFSEQIRNLLLHSKLKINPISELFLFEAARADLVEKVIKLELENGKIILTDRFFDSTTAYQGFGRGINVELVQQINLLATTNLLPDLTFYLDISLKTSFERSMNKPKDRIENSSNNFFEKVINGFKELSKKFPERIIEINAEGDIKQTFELIKDILDKKLI